MGSEHFLRTLAERNDWMNYYVPDVLSEEGRGLPYLYLTSDKVPKENNTKVRVLIEGNSATRHW